MDGPISMSKASLAELATILPPKARAKVLAFEDAAAEMHGAVLAAQEREAEAAASEAARKRELARQREAWAAHGKKLDQETAQRLDRGVADAEAERARRRALREDATARWQEQRRRCDRVGNFLASASSMTITAAAEPKKPNGATLGGVRGEIAQIEDEAERVRTAPRDRKSVIEAIKAEVHTEAEKGAPRIDPRRRDGQPVDLARRLSIASTGHGSLIGDAGSTFWCWLMRDQIVARLSELVPDARDAMTDQQRERRLAELATEKLRLERIEEGLIEEALAEGRKVQRRPDADVRAILGIEVRGA